MSESNSPLEQLSRDELVQRVRDLEKRVDQLEDREYLKALVRQVLSEDETDEQELREELEVAPLPIQRLSRFPEDIAREQLSPNEFRARWVWQNFRDLSHGVQDGRVVKAGELRRMLQSRDGEDQRIYTNTVGRVMEAVVTLTKEIAKVTKSQDGERRLYVPNDWRRRAESLTETREDR